MSGKKYASALKQFDRDQFYGPVEAVGLVKTMASAKFDEGVDVSIRLGVDPRKADQMVRGVVNLPHGTGKTARVLVFANAAMIAAAGYYRYALGHVSGMEMDVQPTWALS